MPLDHSPSRSWRGDGTQAVLSKRRKQIQAVKQPAKTLANGKHSKKQAEETAAQPGMG